MLDFMMNVVNVVYMTEREREGQVKKLKEECRAFMYNYWAELMRQSLFMDQDFSGFFIQENKDKYSTKTSLIFVWLEKAKTN